MKKLIELLTALFNLLFGQSKQEIDDSNQEPIEEEKPPVIDQEQPPVEDKPKESGYVQLLPFIYDVIGEVSLCHKYARECFNVAFEDGYGTSHKAWKLAKKKHTTREMPNVDVPVHFMWTGEVNGVKSNYGHTVVWKADEKVFYSVGSNSSKENAKGYVFDKKHFSVKYESIDRIIQFYGKTCKFLGWTEDINGVPVVEWVEGSD